MAETIRGINLVIGAETQALTAALSDVNKNARNIQSELKQVEKLLKLDPTNTQLVAQQQELLGQAIANSEEKLNRLRAAQEQVNAQFAAGDISEGQYRAFQREVVRAEQELNNFRADADRTRQSIEGLFDDVTTDRLVRELQAGGEAGRAAAEEISRALSGVDDDVDRNRRSVLMYGDAWRTMSQDARRELDDVRDELRQTENSADDLKGKIAGVMAGVAGMGIADAMDSATSSSGHLRAMLGMTKEEAEEFDSIAKQVYGDNFGESMREASEVTARTHQALKLTGEELKNQTENVFRLNDVFSELGADTQINIEAARAITVAWGIDAQTAFDIITTGFQNGTGNAGDLLDTFQEYPPHFQAIGLSATDMLNWLSAGMANGARNTDYLADAVKEFGIRVKTEGDTAQLAIQKMFPADEAQRIINGFAQGGEAGRNAFFKVFEALNQAGSEQEKYTLGVQLMGTKFEDLTANQISNLVAEFAKTKDATMDLSGATASMDEEYAGLQKTLEEIKRTLATSLIAPLGDFVPIVTGVVDVGAKLGLTFLGLSAVGVNVGGVMSKVSSIISKIGLIIRGIVLVITSLSSVVLPALGAAFVTAFEIITSPITLVAGLIAGLIYLGYEIYKNWEGLKQLALDVWTGISDAVGIAVNYIKMHWQGFKDFFVNLWESIWGPVRNVLNSMIDGINLVIEGLNKINISVPDWDILPDSIQGKSWGVNISQIPKLHDGGVFRTLNPDGEGLALLKDGERVIPDGVTPATNVSIDYNRLAGAVAQALNGAKFITDINRGTVKLMVGDVLRREVRI